MFIILFKNCSSSVWFKVLIFRLSQILDYLRFKYTFSYVFSHRYYVIYMYFYSSNNEYETPVLSPTVFEWHTNLDYLGFRLESEGVCHLFLLCFIRFYLPLFLFSSLGHVYIFSVLSHNFYVDFIGQWNLCILFADFVLRVSSFSLRVHAYCFLLEYCVSGSAIQTISTMFTESLLPNI
jgi:hypothetical protein